MDHIRTCPRGLPDPRPSAPRQPGLAAAHTCSEGKEGAWCSATGTGVWDIHLELGILGLGTCNLDW